MNSLTEEQLDRVAGVVLGTAVGDALGAPYEFEVAIPGPDGPQMIGGGLGDFAPGEWTDDTTLAWAVLDVAATGADLRSEDALTAIARHFYTWYRSGPPDIGAQTSMVLRSAGPDPTGTAMTAVSADTHARTGHTAGNGSLMRTAPVALAYLNDPDGLVQAARQVSALTHYDPQAQNACALWSLAIRHAVISGELDLRGGLAHLDDADAQYWTDRIDEAETRGSSSFRPNGWVVTALQAAWSSIHHTRADFDGDPQHLSQALTRAIAIGNDTDTVAAIAGGLLGARYGASAVPTGWREMCHGYPGLTGEDLIALALQAAAR
ncbi:ADP-ribosylglycohydrolase family protein [Williamsia sp. CHRR-6]|uniref:ADP-ribosylglycohydrolase family protein n=1 Tax=Williamsia sp. CHRR-6 TaxID=2835871 RepID=UPI001BDB2698|nr:ADP-ribosylglycohydrolase family protein [Williamsia sp. CHRR-6]MBT0567101.1 ADP-ribosylglycohydrolase family protein [Williamsia sp. CHRR-6]